MSVDVEQIKARLDIGEVVREYLTLKQSGAHLKACCPFHEEKSPSFMVNRQRQIWHCFGCNEGGDIFTFIQRIENVDFREALKLLAEKAGVELSTTAHNEINRSERARLLDVLNTAAHVYARILREVDGAAGARTYLEKRGVSPAMREQFLVGCAPTGWDTLTNYLLQKGFSLEDCVASGMTIVKDSASGKRFDRFRSRIMFPISDAHGRIIGFTGRILEQAADEKTGKYVNTPETPLFHKGSVVYGLNFAKQAIKQVGFAVLVEGQMDVIACHGAGMAEVVACSGTALTGEQLKLLHRYTDELRMAFDADAAGIAAAERSITTALAEGFLLKIIRIPDGAGKDADECIQNNLSVWQSAVRQAKPFMEDLLAHLVPEAERESITRDPRRKDVLSKKIVSYIALIPSAVERDHWIQRAGLEIHTSPDALQELLVRARTVGQTDKKLVVTSGVTSGPADERRRAFQHLMEERLCALLQDQMAEYPRVVAELPAVAICNEEYRSRYENMAVAAPDPLLELLVSAAYADLDVTERVAEIHSLAKRLRSVYYIEQREQLLHQIKRAEEAGDEESTRALLARYQTFVL